MLQKLMRVKKTLANPPFDYYKCVFASSRVSFAFGLMVWAAGAEADSLQEGVILQSNTEILVPTQKVTLTLPQSLLEDAEEFEILLQSSELSVESVRLTPVLVPTMRKVVIQVPNLPATHARFLIRAGSGGREWLVAASHDFFIVPGDARTIPTLAFRQGEYWFHESPIIPPGTLVQGWQRFLPFSLPWLSFKRINEIYWSPAPFWLKKLLEKKTPTQPEATPLLASWQVTFPQRE